MANDGHVKIGTEVDKSGAEKGLSELGSYAQKGFAAVGNAAETAMKTVTVAVGAASSAVTALTTSAVKGYAEYEQLVGGIETLFGAGGASVEEYADKVGKSVSEVKDEYNTLIEAQTIALENANNAYKTAGLSANEYMETVTSFAASLKQSTTDEVEAAEAANQAVVDMSDNANKMGTSMESIQNAYQGFAKQNYTMLDNLKLGYGGTKEEMQRLLADAEKLTGIKYDIGNLSDVYSAIHVIQTELGITGTTAKEASTTIEGSMNAAKSAWSNLVVGIADDTQDFSVLADNFVESVVIAADNLLPRIETSISGIGTLIEELLPEIVDRIPAIIDDILPDLVQSGVNLVDSLVDGIEQNLTQIASTGTEILSSLATGILTITGSAFSLGANIMNNIADSLSLNLPILVEKGKELVSSITEGITANLPGIINSAVSIVTSLVTGLAQMIPDIVLAGLDMIMSLAAALTDPGNLSSIIDAGINLIIGLLEGCIEALPKLIEYVPLILSNLVQAIIDNLPKLLIAAIKIMGMLGQYMIQSIGALLTVIPNIFKELKNKFQSLEWSEIGHNLIEGIKNGIKNAASGLVDSAVNAAKDAVNAVKDWLGIASPSKLMRDLIGKNMIAGVNVGIEEETPKLEKTSVYSAKRAVESMQGQAISRGQRITSGIERSISGSEGGEQAEVVVKLEKGSISGDVIMDGEKVGTLVAPTVDIEIEKARKESER